MYDGCNLCPWGDCKPPLSSLVKSEFNLEADVNRLTGILAQLKSMTYSKIKEDYKDDLMDMFIKRSEMQRNEIVAAYKAKTNVEVGDEISKMPVGAPRYEILMKALAMPLPWFYVRKFSNAMKVQNNEKISDLGRISMVEMLISLPSCLVHKIIEAYNSGSRDFFADLNKSLVTAKMPSDYISTIERLAKADWGNDNGLKAWVRAFSDANKLKKSVASKPIDEVKTRYSELFTKQSFSHIVKTIKVYENLKNEGSFLKDINDKGLGNVDEIYKTMTSVLLDKTLYFAKKMEQILLNRGRFLEDYVEIEFVGLIRGRFDIDLQDIIDRYNKEADKGFIKERFVEGFKSFVSNLSSLRDPMFQASVLQITT